MTDYKAVDGKVFARVDGRWDETGTALTANGRDLERFDRALDVARRQREQATVTCPDCGRGRIAPLGYCGECGLHWDDLAAAQAFLDEGG